MIIKKIHQAFLAGIFPLASFIIFFIFIRFLGKCEWNDPIVWITVGIQLCIALSLLYLTQTFSIIRERSFLPAIFYLLLIGTNTDSYLNWAGSLYVLGVLICFYLLFQAYQNPVSQSISFGISAVLTLGSLKWPLLILLVPVFWYGFVRFRSFNLKVVFAGIIGILFVHLLFFSGFVYTDNLSGWKEISISNFSAFRIYLFNLELRDSLILSYMLVLFILSGTNIYIAGISEKIKTITILSYLFVFAVFVSIFLMLFNQSENEWINILYLPFSLVVSHFFTLIWRKWTFWLLIFTILFFLAMFIWQVYFPGL